MLGMPITIYWWWSPRRYWCLSSSSVVGVAIDVGIVCKVVVVVIFLLLRGQTTWKPAVLGHVDHELAHGAGGDCHALGLEGCRLVEGRGGLGSLEIEG